MKNILKEIEEKYAVNKILVDGVQIWPFIRIIYDFKYILKKEKTKKYKYSLKELFFYILVLLKNIFYGWTNWFRRYEYIAFSSSSTRKEINGKFFNRFLDQIIDEIGREKVLCIEEPNPEHYPVKYVHTKHITSNSLITLLAHLIEKITPKYLKIENKNILNIIKQEYDLNVDDYKIIKLFNIKIKFFKFLYRLIKPKAIFVVCYYCERSRAALKAAKDLGIKVIEIQHGVIVKNHSEYNIYVKLDKTFFPDYLLVFGEKEVELFRESKFISYKNVYPVGSFYIDYIKENLKPELNSDLIKKMKKYRSCVGVTLQAVIEDITIEFIRQAANLDENILYILIPRQPLRRKYSTLELPKNVTVVINRNFYELMMYVDFHATVNSTCAIEAPPLGVQNIMININNLSKFYYGNILNNNQITRYADTPDEFVKLVNLIEKLDKNVVCEMSENIIISNYKQNIKNFIREVVLRF